VSPIRRGCRELTTTIIHLITGNSDDATSSLTDHKAEVLALSKSQDKPQEWVGEALILFVLWETAQWVQAVVVLALAVWMF
jgi:hypothetical protein